MFLPIKIDWLRLFLRPEIMLLNPVLVGEQYFSMLMMLFLEMS
jgi:hypothetical protein